MRLGLFGSYDRLNFGDDLLAYYISYVLRNRYDVTVLSKCNDLHLPEGVNRCSKVEEFVNSSDLLVLGGGGFLTSTSDPVLEDMLVSIIKCALNKQIPLYILSIGGDQKPSEDVWNYLGDGRKALFNYPYLQKCTVRTKEDFYNNNSKFEFQEDVLWNSIDSLSPSVIEFDKHKPYVIGIHFSSIPILRIATALAELISIITFRRIQFLYFRTHDSSMNNLEELGRFLPFKTNLVQHSGDVLPFIQNLKKVDILFSAKMHIGLLCLSMGKPFISFGGPIKAQNLLIRLGLETCIMPSSPRILLLFLLSLFFHKGKRREYTSLVSSMHTRINEIKASCIHNFDSINIKD